VALAQDFEAVVETLPDDWTDLELELRPRPYAAP
jgi:hypothetical protein